MILVSFLLLISVVRFSCTFRKLVNVGAIYEALIFNKKREGKLARMTIMQHIDYYI